MAMVLWKGGNGDRLEVDGNEEVYRIAEGREYRRPILEDGSVFLGEGPDGMTRKRRPGVITADNPLLFTCAHCHTESTALEKPHTPGCKHPWAGAA